MKIVKNRTKVKRQQRCEIQRFRFLQNLPLFQNNLLESQMTIAKGRIVICEAIKAIR